MMRTKTIKKKIKKIVTVVVDYFNKRFGVNIDPNVVKALIASESSFNENPPKSTVAFGIAQITLATLKILQDESGEAKQYTFKGITKNDLLDPETNIALAVRWLYRKRETAKAKLGREPTSEEIILEYKGLLNSSSYYKEKALENYRKNYGKLVKTK